MFESTALVPTSGSYLNVRLSVPTRGSCHVAFDEAARA